MAVSLKYLSNRRSLGLALINCEVALALSRTKDCVLIEATLNIIGIKLN